MLEVPVAFFQNHHMACIRKHDITLVMCFELGAKRQTIFFLRGEILRTN